MSRPSTVLDDLVEPMLPGVADAASETWVHLGRPGRWWTGEERVAIAAGARRATPRPLWDRAPDLDVIDHEGGDPLSPFVDALVERVAVEPSTLTRALVHRVVERIGDAAYAELCAVIAQVVAIDHLFAALGHSPAPFPDAVGGEPSRERPAGMADVGGHIEMAAESFGPNVARSLSLAAEDSERWLGLVLTMYAGEAFFEMVWDDRILVRPQVELLAARTSALNECFY